MIIGRVFFLVGTVSQSALLLLSRPRDGATRHRGLPLRAQQPPSPSSPTPRNRRFQARPSDSSGGHVLFRFARFAEGRTLWNASSCTRQTQPNLTATSGGVARTLQTLTVLNESNPRLRLFEAKSSVART